MLFYKIYNFIQSILEFSRKYIYAILPLFSFVIYLFLKDFLFNNISDAENYLNNIVNLSGILAGFMLTTYATFMTSLPDNKFIKALKHSGYLNSIYKVIGLGILFFILSMLAGLFSSSPKLTTILFFLGVSEALSCLYYFYFVLKYSNMSD